MFADLKGSMELLAERDPEEARQLLDPVLEHMMAAVHRYEGTVNQVMGDGIMALFGAPLAHEDHAVRACYAALCMQEAVKEYATEVQRTHGVPIHIRVGLNAGKVVVRSIGSDLPMDYTAVGQTTHLAARMEQMAMPGAILITPAVLGLVEGFMQVKTLGAMPVRGLRDPVAVYEVTGAGMVQSRLQVAAARGLTRFVWRQPELETLQMPATVQAVLAARVDRLPPQEKHVLQSAAVIGTEVPVSLVQAIAELPEADLYRGLAHLQAAEVLYETRLFPERAFTFKHALTHEVAYNGLLQEWRRVLHARIVEALEALAGERVAEQVERLAHHALQGMVWDKALVYARQAGEKAMARSAYREAVWSFEQALSVLQHLPEQCETCEHAIDLRIILRSALIALGDPRRAMACLREAEALAAALDDPRRLGRVLRFVARQCYYESAHDQAIATAQRALTLVAAGGDAVLYALACQDLGNFYQAQGHYRRAMDCFTQTMVCLDGARRRERFAELIFPAVYTPAWRAWCHAELGTFAEGRALAEEGLRLAEEVAHSPSLLTVSWGLGLLCLRQGDLPKALPLLERSMHLCQEVALSALFPMVAAALGAAYTLVGRLAAAVPVLTEAIEQAMTMGRRVFQAHCRLALSEALLLAGRLDEAHALAEQTLELAGAHHERGNEAWSLRLHGEIAMHREPPDIELAIPSYQQALTLANALGMRPLQAHCHRGLGTLYAATGQREQARTALSTAMEMYRAMEMTFWLPETEATLAQMEAQ